MRKYESRVQDTEQQRRIILDCDVHDDPQPREMLKWSRSVYQSTLKPLRKFDMSIYNKVSPSHDSFVNITNRDKHRNSRDTGSDSEEIKEDEDQEEQAETEVQDNEESILQNVPQIRKKATRVRVSIGSQENVQEEVDQTEEIQENHQPQPEQVNISQSSTGYQIRQDRNSAPITINLPASLFIGQQPLHIKKFGGQKGDFHTWKRLMIQFLLQKKLGWTINLPDSIMPTDKNLCYQQNIEAYNLIQYVP